MVYGVSATCIIFNEERVLLIKRPMHKKRFPGRWSVPGGKLEADDHSGEPDTKDNTYYSPLEACVRREVFEETGLVIEGLTYVDSMVTVPEDGPPSLIVSFYAELASDSVVAVKMQANEVDEAVWVPITRIDQFDLIEGIGEEIYAAFARKGIW